MSLRHRWYWASVVVGLMAIAAELQSKHHASQATGHRANQASWRPIVQDQSGYADKPIEYHRQRCTVWHVAGICMIAAMTTAWIMSWRKREQASTGVLVAVAGIYLLLHMILV